MEKHRIDEFGSYRGDSEVDDESSCQNSDSRGQMCDSYGDSDMLQCANCGMLVCDACTKEGKFKPCYEPHAICPACEKEFTVGSEKDSCACGFKPRNEKPISYTMQRKLMYSMMT